MKFIARSHCHVKTILIMSLVLNLYSGIAIVGAAENQDVRREINYNRNGVDSQSNNIKNDTFWDTRDGKPI